MVNNFNVFWIQHTPFRIKWNDVYTDFKDSKSDFVQTIGTFT